MTWEGGARETVVPLVPNGAKIPTPLPMQSPHPVLCTEEAQLWSPVPGMYLLAQLLGCRYEQREEAVPAP